MEKEHISNSKVRLEWLNKCTFMLLILCHRWSPDGIRVCAQVRFGFGLVWRSKFGLSALGQNITESLSRTRTEITRSSLSLIDNRFRAY